MIINTTKKVWAKKLFSHVQLVYLLKHSNFSLKRKHKLSFLPLSDIQFKSKAEKNHLLPISAFQNCDVFFPTGENPSYTFARIRIFQILNRISTSENTTAEFGIVSTFFRHQNSRAPEHQNTRTSKHQNIRAPQHQNTRAFKTSVNSSTNPYFVKTELLGSAL